MLWFASAGGRRGSLLVALAGLLGGFAVDDRVHRASSAVVIWRVRARASADRLRRGLAYAAGLFLGRCSRSALYNQWAFGSPTHLSYEENQVEPIGGFFGVGVPSLHALSTCSSRRGGC